jgi:hypothetical protein
MVPVSPLGPPDQKVCSLSIWNQSLHRDKRFYLFCNKVSLYLFQTRLFHEKYQIQVSERPWNLGEAQTADSRSGHQRQLPISRFTYVWRCPGFVYMAFVSLG